MAIQGRRQPHAPLILRGGQFQRPVGHFCIFGQKTGQHAAQQYFYRQFPPKIIKGGGRPSVNRLLVAGQKTAQHAAQRYFYRQFPPIIKRGIGRKIPTAQSVVVGQAVKTAAQRFFYRSFTNVVIKRSGPRKSSARQRIVLAPSAYRPARQPVIILGLPNVLAPPPAAPVAVTLVFGQKTSQHAARWYYRQFPPIIKLAGGLPAVGQLLVIQEPSVRLAADRYARSRFPPIVLPPTVPPPPPPPTTPVAVTLVFGQQTSQLSARGHYRQFPPLINRAGGQPATGRSLAPGQKTSQLAAQRYFYRQFPPIIKRGGGRPSVAHTLVVLAPSAYRPARRPVLVSKAPPPPVTLPPVGVTLIFGQKTSQLAVRYTYRQFPPIIKRGGPPKPAGRLLAFFRLAQSAARRPQGLARVFIPPVVLPPPPPPPPPVSQEAPTGLPLPPVGPTADVIDDDTERAVVAFWLATTRDLGVGTDVIDQDTEAAVVTFWSANVQLFSLFSAPPRTGRQKSGYPGQDPSGAPYVVVESRFEKRDLAYAEPTAKGPFHDYRMVTLTVYGTRADVVAGAALIMAVFNRSLGAQNQPTLTYPSGARFIRWWPVGQVEISEDPATKAGKDVWRAVIRGRVWSVRST